MPIATFPIGPLDTNCHVVYTERDALVVDPGGDIDGGLQDVLDFIARKELSVKAVLLTHLHFDHIYGVAPLKERFPSVPVFASAGDLPLLSTSLASGEKWGLPPVRPFTPATIAEGPCMFGSIHGEIRFTPGHTPGGLSFWMPQEHAVITGDSLFYRSIGRTDLPGGHLPALTEAIISKLFTLPDDTDVYPGHGPNTRIGDEKRLNPFVRPAKKDPASR